MRINHNISAINTNRLLASNNSSTSKSLEKLSSGLSINRAGDNAAGLAISEKMRGQIRGLNQATSNANDGISLIQTAEGGLNETHAILQRMRELAVQSANDTNTDDDRKQIQKEVEQLKTEITRIAKNTEFNTKKLLNGDLAMSATESDATVAVGINAGANVDGGTYTVTVNKTAATLKTAAVSKVDGEAQISSGTATVALADDAAKTKYNAKIAGMEAGDEIATYTGGAWKKDGAVVDLSEYGITVTGTPDADQKITVKTAYVAPAAAVYNDDAKVEITAVKDASGNAVDASAFTVSVEDAASLTAGSADISVTVDSSKALTFHIGANKDQNTKLSVQNMDATAIGVNNVNLTTQAGANSAISTIDDAINIVSTQRAALGAMQNRLEHTINNLGTSSENLSAAESQIRDVDMAEEMSNYTKNNILVQAATSMLAQANQQPQSVLSLLG